MITFILFLSCIFVALAFGAMAAVSDFRGMTIPNGYSVVIFGAFAACYALMWGGGVHDAVFADLSSHLIGFAVVFGLTLVLYSMKVWGAGDQKMISAFAVWFGFAGLPLFLTYTAIFGGLIGIAALCIRKFKPFATPPQGSWVETVQAGESKVPYGIAIAAGALASFVKIGYLGVDTFRIFTGF